MRSQTVVSRAAGNAQQDCGNDTHISVLVSPGTPLTVKLTKHPQPVTAGQETDLTITDVLNSDVQTAFDPGDGSLTTGFSFSGMTSHVYSTSGHYLAVVTAQRHSVVIINRYRPVVSQDFLKEEKYPPRCTELQLVKLILKTKK